MYCCAIKTNLILRIVSTAHFNWAIINLKIIFAYTLLLLSLTHDTHAPISVRHTKKAVLCTTQIPFSTCTMCLRALINFQFQVAQFFILFRPSRPPNVCSCTNLLNNVSGADAISFTWSIQIHMSEIYVISTFIHVRNITATTGDWCVTTSSAAYFFHA